ncbi:hypothetical protein GCK72_022145 [Caenorhabditis remanei]|uniref:Uncharacterized protein n=1 Tax=Caenorhabditis remanei TaxID=31234 RepID=A0A6A5FSY8_CAERE|nr:hypothetical protein GCK72_022145 [Caenorhabditis remanei]KAF1745698.1 hypothetical protein GCK72_022145 [Caenorhabditis remanei]
MNLILAFLSLVGLAQCAHVLNHDLKPLTIEFEIGVNESSVYSVQLGKIMNAVCESKTKELKISVQASSPVDVHLCNCNEKDYQQKFGADELSLDSEKMRNMSLVICGSEARNDNLEFTISGTKGTRGKIVLEVVDNEKHSAIELLYEFKIPEDRGIYVNLTEFESLSRLGMLFGTDGPKCCE